MKKNCIICSNPLKVDTNKPIHRKCWLKTRDFEDRYLDFLFMNDRKHKPPAKSFVIKPCDSDEDSLDMAIEEIKQIINEAKPLNYELDSSVSYECDIAGNIISI